MGLLRASPTVFTEHASQTVVVEQEPLPHKQDGPQGCPRGPSSELSIRRGFGRGEFEIRCQRLRPTAQLSKCPAAPAQCLEQHPGSAPSLRVRGITCEDQARHARDLLPRPLSS